MDIQNLIIESKARFNHNQAKQYLKDKYQSKLTFADQGGLWVSSPSLLSQLTSTNDKNLVLLDEYENPVKVDRNILLQKANEIYVSVMEQWHNEWSILEKKR
jgi:CTP:phosphocholine cytidylyltransferase-like protein